MHAMQKKEILILKTWLKEMNSNLFLIVGSTKTESMVNQRKYFNFMLSYRYNGDEGIKEKRGW